MLLDASPITKHLYVGSLPPTGDIVARAGFQVLVLCANDYQPPAYMFEGLTTLIYAPLEDAEITPSQAVLARETARLCSKLIKHGKNVLITCVEGRNRSALVAALTVRMTTKLSGIACVKLVRNRRKPLNGRQALTNPYFVQLIANS